MAIPLFWAGIAIIENRYILTISNLTFRKMAIHHEKSRMAIEIPQHRPELITTDAVGIRRTHRRMPL